MLSYNRHVKEIFVGLSTFTKPFKIYRISPDGLKKDSYKWNLYYEQESPLNTDNIEAKIEFFTSKDGTRVPIFIIHKKGLDLNGKNPTLLYGYGGFNAGMSPNYIGTQAMFVNRGGVYCYCLYTWRR